MARCDTVGRWHSLHQFSAAINTILFGKNGTASEDVSNVDLFRTEQEFEVDMRRYSNKLV